MTAAEPKLGFSWLFHFQHEAFSTTSHPFWEIPHEYLFHNFDTYSGGLTGNPTP